MYKKQAIDSISPPLSKENIVVAVAVAVAVVAILLMYLSNKSCVLYMHMKLKEFGYKMSFLRGL
jgi:hypothetical protein